LIGFGSQEIVLIFKVYELQQIIVMDSSTCAFVHVLFFKKKKDFNKKIIL
jgi:hypothetical protein